MFSLIPSRLGVFCAFACLALPVRALERVTLRNGFSLDCAHHATIGSHIRLYTGADDTSFQELPATEITAIETLPDPPKSITPSTPPQILSPAAQNHLTSVTEVHQLLSAAGTLHHIDADLLAAVVKAESNFNATATSRAGARGLMQLMPSTARDLGVQNITAPDQNINGGTAYLDQLLTLYHDNIDLALAAYNAGPAAVAKYHGIPPFPETRAYVARVIREFNRRKTIDIGQAR